MRELQNSFGHSVVVSCQTAAVGRKMKTGAEKPGKRTPGRKKFRKIVKCKIL